MSKWILLIGDAGRDEFSDAVDWLSAHGNLSCAAQPADALRDDSNGKPPETIVFAQSWPGQWSDAEVNALHEHWPLARLIVMLGSWSEGEPRTGRPCQGAWRIYWYDFERRLTAVLGDASKQMEFGRGSWNMPRLATDVERLAFDLTGSKRPMEVAGRRRACPDGAAPGPVRNHHLDPLKFTLPRLVIRARSRDAYESLSDACACRGYVTTWQRTSDVPTATGAVAGIWDVAGGLADLWASIAEFASSLDGAPIVVTANFPRRDDWRTAAALNVALLAKPFQLPDLWLALQHSASMTATIPTSAKSAQSANCSTS